MEKIERKKELISACIEHQKETIGTAQKAIASVQESVAEEKSTIEDSMESFRESLQNEREMYARQVQDGIEGLSVLNRISPTEHNSIKLGSVVRTNMHNYFVSISMGEIKLGDDKFLAISTQSPIYQLLAGKKKGDSIQFRNQDIKILDVY